MQKIIHSFLLALASLGLGQCLFADDAPAFRVGVFDQNGVQAFMENHQELEEDALQEALAAQLEGLAARYRLPLIFLHDTNDASPFIYLTQPVETVILNQALVEVSPEAGEAPAFPAGSKLGTLQVQHLLDQILDNESIKAQLSQQFNAIKEVQELLEEIEFYDGMLGEIEKRGFTSQQVENRYGLSREEIDQLAVNSLARLQAAESQFNQQVTRFYVQIIVGLAFDIAEDEEFTHIFQFRNGPSPRLVFNNGATIADLTGKVADQLNQMNLEDPESTAQ